MEKPKFYTPEQPILAQIRAMEAGTTLAFPIQKVGYIRSNISLFGLMFQCKYRSHVNRADKTIEVTRIN